MFPGDSCCDRAKLRPAYPLLPIAPQERINLLPTTVLAAETLNGFAEFGQLKTEPASLTFRGHLSALKPCQNLIVQCVLLASIALGEVRPAWSQGDQSREIDLSVDPGAAQADPQSADSLLAAKTPKRTPYAGLSLWQAREGVLVGGILPGPFGGDGFKSPSIWRGDFIVSMNGQSLDVEGYIRLIHSLAAGDLLQVVYRRSANPDPYSAIPNGDPQGNERSVDVILDDASRWSGLIGQGLAPGHAILPARSGEFEDLLLTKAEELGLRSAHGGVDALLKHLSSVQQSLLAPGSLPAVVQALQRPLSLDRTEADIASQVRPLAEAQSLQETLLALHRFLLRTLDVPDLQSQPDVAAKLSEAKRNYQQRAASLMRAMRDDVTPLDQDLPQYLELIRVSADLVPLSIAMLPRVAQYAMELEKFAREVCASPQPIAPELAERVHAAVEGPVLGAKLVDGELWVVGGEQANRYNMDLIAAVFDVGGPDVYTFSAPQRGLYQIVIDESGDDVYESKADLAGPATGVFGVSVLWDRAGNDQYRSNYQGSIAAGLFGVGILVDEAGDDRYINDTPGAGWSEGAGFYGAGVLIDRAGDDLYQAQILAQGVGGPGGVGLIVEGSGNDTYIANGPHFPSVYGTAGVFAGMSQGFGVGFRGYAPGGIGAIYDFAGNDFYSVGEFGQGTGYFQGLGIIHDVAGDDRYVGARYAQGSGVHQGAGILVDDAGDDVYSCSGPAAQGASWDQGVAMLIDRAGNDSYHGDGFAQGAAAHQAVGILIDLDGEDTYSCTNTCLGQSGDNAYHYDTSQVFSFSAFIDRGGKTDTYPESRSNNKLIRTGTLLPDNPAASDCYGLFLDE